MKLRQIVGSAAALAALAACADVTVTEFLKADGQTDVSDALQKVIDGHPNQTIRFPDGVYLLSKPVLTPADPKLSVDLQLSNYAVIRAAPDWNSDEAMIRLGASHKANDIRTPGSCYSLTGGIIDGSGVAKGVSIDGGRETKVMKVSMKRVFVGLHIKKGANNGSSDCDISDVNIVGNGATNSVGVICEGHDNTFTNMRIADVYTGVRLTGGGNSLRNIHPLFTCRYDVYEQSAGFDIRSGNNWMDFCYSDHFSIGFRIAEGSNGGVFDKCFCMWYAANPKRRHTAIQADGQFRAVFRDLTVGFKNREAVNSILRVGKGGGTGVIDCLRVNRELVNDPARTHEQYFSGRFH